MNASENKDVIIPEGAEIRIIQNTEDTRYLILPVSPKSLTEAELKMVAGGDSVKNATNVVNIGEVVNVTVEAEVHATTTTYLAEAEVAVAAVLVLI